MQRLTLNERVLKLAPSATLSMKARAKELSDRGISVVTLSAGEPDFETPKVIVDAARRALEKGVSRYTGVRGSDELINAMRLKFERDQKVNYDATQVLSTVGAKAAINLALDAAIGPGDEVIIFAPYWVSYPEQVRLAGGEPVIVYASAEQGYIPTIESFRAAITPKTKAVILNSPNNPTGAVFSEKILRGIMDAVSGSSIWVISDEIYEHLVFDDAKHVSPAAFSEDAYSRTVVISGASKGYAMTGWRVGIAGGPRELISGMAKLQEQRYTCIASIAQAAAAYAFLEPDELLGDIEKMRQSYQNRRDALMGMLGQLKQVTCVKPQGAFYALLDFSAWMGKMHRGFVIENDEMLANRLLTEAHVAMVAGTPFGALGCVRMSLASSMADIEEGITRIKNWLE